MSEQPIIGRRGFVLGGAASFSLAPPAFAHRVAQRVWVFDNLRRIGGGRVIVRGNPKLVAGPSGRAISFDGIDDALMIADHPLAGASAFTFEVLFRPDGGAFEQRWFHLESDEQPPVAPGKGSTRMLFEIRVVEDRWYLDTFMTGPGYRQTLMVPAKTFPVGRWYHVAQTYDGRAYRSFVNGKLQAEVVTSFIPQARGKSSVGMRMNGVNHFRGAIASARFTHKALPVSSFAILKEIRE